MGFEAQLQHLFDCSEKIQRESSDADAKLRARVNDALEWVAARLNDVEDQIALKSQKERPPGPWADELVTSTQSTNPSSRTPHNVACERGPRLDTHAKPDP